MDALPTEYHQILISAGFIKQSEISYRKTLSFHEIVFVFAGGLANATEYPKAGVKEFEGISIDLFKLMAVRNTNDLNYLIQHIRISDS